MSADKLTDEQRRERALALDQVAAKIKTEYGDALAALGYMPVIQWISNYSVEDHVAHARSRGIELNLRAQEIQRDYIDALRGASTSELALVTHVLSALLEVDDLGMRHRGVLDELIAVLSTTEATLERKVRQRAEREWFDE
jgi:hypothetical protein